LLRTAAIGLVCGCCTLAPATAGEEAKKSDAKVIRRRSVSAQEKKVIVYRLKYAHAETVISAMKPMSGDDAPKPPEALTDVVAELFGDSISGLRQLGQAVVRTASDGRFDVDCLCTVGQYAAEWRIRGTLRQQKGTQYLQIELSAAKQVHVTSKDGPGRIEPMSLVDLETEICAPDGDYVLLGAAPSDADMMSVFAVQIIPIR